MVVVIDPAALLHPRGISDDHCQSGSRAFLVRFPPCSSSSSVGRRLPHAFEAGHRRLQLQSLSVGVLLLRARRPAALLITVIILIVIIPRQILAAPSSAGSRARLTASLRAGGDRRAVRLLGVVRCPCACVGVDRKRHAAEDLRGAERRIVEGGGDAGLSARRRRAMRAHAKKAGDRGFCITQRRESFWAGGLCMADAATYDEGA